VQRKHCSIVSPSSIKIAGRGDRMHQEIEFAPVVFDLIKDGLHVTWRPDVERHEKLR
jgi:hypothetical protein